jgi:FtsP/CotA-like multicopper oxidase with cupredoxin domain
LVDAATHRAQHVDRRNMMSRGKVHGTGGEGGMFTEFGLCAGQAVRRCETLRALAADAPGEGGWAVRGRRATIARLQLAAMTIVLLLLAGCRTNTTRPSTTDTARAALLREFTGSLPMDAAPNGIVRTVDLVAAPTELRLVDGTTMRVWAYNGTVPGPTLRIRLGETLRVRLTNRLPQPTTIHWHGVRVPNAMDGVPVATQAAIAPGDTFVYEFTPKDAGTFWFHPHIRSSEQVERGLYGVLIVDDATPLPYSQDLVWVLDDWLRDEQGQIVERFNTGHDLMHDGRWGNAVTVNSRTDEVLHVAAGERIRLRLLNAANGRIFLPDLSRLDARLIAVDGTYLRAPIDPKAVEIAPGNRMDLDITFASATNERIAIFDRFYGPRPNHLADIAVDDIVPTAAVFPSPAHAHIPEWRAADEIPLDQEFRLNARRGGPLGIEWTINDRAVSLHEHDAAPMMTMVKEHFYRLRFTNESFRLHPIHLHGMFFRLLSRNGVAVAEPFFRDTVLVHAKETIDVGVVPLDSGRWMMHCHILEHAEAGMMTFTDVTP